MGENKYGFGQTISDDVEPFSDSQWIRTFREQETKIRVLPAEGYNAAGELVTGYKAWPSELEHFNEDLSLSFPCLNTKEHGLQDCRGCQSDSKRVRDRSRRYYVNAIGGDDDEVRIWKFGGAVYDKFQMRQDRAIAADPENLQPLSDRDYFVLKGGSGLKTTYDLESGEAYDIKFPDPLDVGDAITDSFEDAMKAYDEADKKAKGRGGDRAAGSAASGLRSSGRRADDDEPPARTSRNNRTVEDDEPPARSSRTRTRSSSEEVEDKARRSRDWKDQGDDEPPAFAGDKGGRSPKQEAADHAASNGSGFDITVEDIEAMETTGEIREWIADNGPAGYDIPRGAPRSKLVKIAGFILEGAEPPF